MEATDKLQTWRSQGVDFVTDFKTLREQVEVGKIPRHQFLVLDNQQNQMDWEWLSAYINCLPYRIVVVGNIPNDAPQHLKRTMISIDWNELSEKLHATLDELKSFLWEKWVQKWWSGFTLCVRGIGSRDNHGTVAERFYEQGIDDPEDTNLLVYDHQPNSDRTNLFRKADFHECFTGGTPTDTLLKLKDRWMRWRVKEAAAISVGVLDERIFLEKDKEAREGVSKYECASYKKIINAWEKRRVYLFNHEDAINDFEEFVEGVEKKHQALDFFIIHQGIIDEIKKRDQAKQTAKFSKGWSRLKGITRWLIIDSGRGHPDQAIKECLRWVEYSNLADCLVQHAAIKYNLAQLLFALQAEFTTREGT